MYIYCITNNITGKRYVGQTSQKLNSRFRAHCHPKSGGGRSAIKEAIIKYGKENFTIECLETVEDTERLNSKEIFWIEKYNTLTPNGYNLRTGGTSGYKYTEEVKRVMSEKKQGVVPHNKNQRGIIAEATDGSFTLFFKGLSEVLECGFEKSTIYHVINGKYSQYLGMKWSFE